MQIPPLLAALARRNDNWWGTRASKWREAGLQSTIVNRKSTMPLLSPLVHDLFGIEWGAGFEENQTAIILFAVESVCPADVSFQSR